MRSLKSVKKPGDFTKSQLVELVSHFGGDDGGVANALDVLKLKKRILLEENQAQLFSEGGFALDASMQQKPGVNLLQSDPESILRQVSLHSHQHRQCLNKFWNLFTRRSESFGRCVSIPIFDELIEELLQLIRGQSDLTGILATPWFPIVIPKYGPNPLGYQAISQKWISLLTRAIEGEYPNIKNSMDLTFGNFQSSLAIRCSSRHDLLFNLLHRRSVVGIYFPFTLQGWSAEDAIEYVQNLPSGFTLSGVVDTAIAGMCYPEVMFSQKGQSYLMAGAEVNDQRRGRHCIRVGRDKMKSHGSITTAIGRQNLSLPHMSPGLTFIKPWRKWDR